MDWSRDWQEICLAGMSCACAHPQGPCIHMDACQNHGPFLAPPMTRWRILQGRILTTTHIVDHIGPKERILEAFESPGIYHTDTWTQTHRVQLKCHCGTKPQNHSIHGFWALFPYWHSKWTLWESTRTALESDSDFVATRALLKGMA